MKEKDNFNLIRHNTFGFDVSCKHFVEYSSFEELKSLLPHLNKYAKFFHIGAGSNILFTGNFEGCILHSAIRGISRLSERETPENVFIRVGAGMDWDEWVDYSLSQHWYGLENLSLIPGEVGASAVQNIGAYGAEVKDYIDEVEVVDIRNGQVEKLKGAQCGYAYRYSRFKDEWKKRFFVTHVVYKLRKTYSPQISYRGLAQALAESGLDSPTAEQVRDTVIRIRRAKLPDPSEWGNAGSFFMNPIVTKDEAAQLMVRYPDLPHYPMEKGVKIPAGWLIEQCGWKGRSCGRVGVYPRQALVLINRGGATPDEIMALNDAICEDVRMKFGIELHPEVNWI